MKDNKKAIKSSIVNDLKFLKLNISVLEIRIKQLEDQRNIDRFQHILYEHEILCRGPGKPG